MPIVTRNGPYGLKILIIHFIDGNREKGKNDLAMQQDLIANPLCISLLERAAKTDSETVGIACAFCNARIPFGESVCPDCMKKYNIRSYDLASNGCGCDK
jgi:hypothetical protein